MADAVNSPKRPYHAPAARRGRRAHPGGHHGRRQGRLRAPRLVRRHHARPSPTRPGSRSRPSRPSTAPRPNCSSTVVDYAIAGDLRPIPVTGREPVAAMQAAPDATAMLDLHARQVTDISGRSAQIFWVVEQAAAADQDIAGLWAEMSDRGASVPTGPPPPCWANPACRPTSARPTPRRSSGWPSTPAPTAASTLGRGLSPAGFETWIGNLLRQDAPRLSGGAAGRILGGGVRASAVRWGMRIERFGAQDERRADACYEIFRATRMVDDPDVPPMPPRVFGVLLPAGLVAIRGRPGCWPTTTGSRAGTCSSCRPGTTGTSGSWTSRCGRSGSGAGSAPRCCGPRREPGGRGRAPADRVRPRRALPRGLHPRRRGDGRAEGDPPGDGHGFHFNRTGRRSAGRNRASLGRVFAGQLDCPDAGGVPGPGGGDQPRAL